MRNKENKHLGIEIDKELHYKLRYVAEYEGRSGNGQVIYVLKEYIKEFERKNGVINVEQSVSDK